MECSKRLMAWWPRTQLRQWMRCPLAMPPKMQRFECATLQLEIHRRSLRRLLSDEPLVWLAMPAEIAVLLPFGLPRFSPAANH